MACSTAFRQVENHRIHISIYICTNKKIITSASILQSTVCNFVQKPDSLYFIVPYWVTGKCACCTRDALIGFPMIDRGNVRFAHAWGTIIPSSYPTVWRTAHWLVLSIVPRVSFVFSAAVGLLFIGRRYQMIDCKWMGTTGWDNKEDACQTMHKPKGFLQPVCTWRWLVRCVVLDGSRRYYIGTYGNQRARRHCNGIPTSRQQTRSGPCRRGCSTTYRSSGTADQRWNKFIAVTHCDRLFLYIFSMHLCGGPCWSVLLLLCILFGWSVFRFCSVVFSLS